MAVTSRHFAFGCALGFVSGMIGLTIGVLTFGFMFQDFVVQRKEETLRPPPITVGLKAAYNWQVISQEGDILDLQTVRDKTLFISFWHPGCVPCLAQLPSINRLYNKLEGTDIEFIIVATDNKGELPDIIEKESLDFPVYTMLSDRPDVFTSPDTPANFIVDPEGNIMFKQIGGAKWDDENIMDFLLDLSGGTRPDIDENGDAAEDGDTVEAPGAPASEPVEDIDADDAGDAEDNEDTPDYEALPTDDAEEA